MPDVVEELRRGVVGREPLAGFAARVFSMSPNGLSVSFPLLVVAGALVLFGLGLVDVDVRAGVSSLPS